MIAEDEIVSVTVLQVPSGVRRSYPLGRLRFVDGSWGVDVGPIHPLIQADMIPVSIDSGFRRLSVVDASHIVFWPMPGKEGLNLVRE